MGKQVFERDDNVTSFLARFPAKKTLVAQMPPTTLPKFLGWIVKQIFLAVELRYNIAYTVSDKVCLY